MSEELELLDFNGNAIKPGAKGIRARLNYRAPVLERVEILHIYKNDGGYRDEFKVKIKGEDMERASTLSSYTNRFTEILIEE